ncbi:MAG: hypothetical protein U5R49_26660 [Deltaproteobacteria bacterium]|nr:hypothetical protein [Deltaproteobacteria bacterium]
MKLHLITWVLHVPKRGAAQWVWLKDVFRRVPTALLTGEAE